MHTGTEIHSYFSALYFSLMACCGSVSAFRKVSLSAMMHSLEWQKARLEFVTARQLMLKLISLYTMKTFKSS